MLNWRLQIVNRIAAAPGSRSSERWLHFLCFCMHLTDSYFNLEWLFWAIFRRNTCNWSETSNWLTDCVWWTCILFCRLARFRLFSFQKYLSFLRDTMNLFWNRFSSGHYDISLFFYVHLCLSVCWQFANPPSVSTCYKYSIHSIHATLPSCHLSQKCLIHNLSSVSFDAFRREKNKTKVMINNNEIRRKQVMRQAR